MGKNLGAALRREFANLEKDFKTAMGALRSIVKEIDAKLIPVFVAELSETKEIGSESDGYTVSLFEDLARAHGVKIAPHIERIMPVIKRTLSSSKGSVSIQQACSKAVAAMARYGIEPATPKDKRRSVIHSLCKPLSDSLIDSHHQQHLALGSALCLKALVDCDNWRCASDVMVNEVCQSLAVAIQATSSEANSHMALVMALAKHNPFIIEAYVRLLVTSGLRILDLGVVEEDAEKRLLAIQMLNFLMKTLDPKSMCSELELIHQEMEKHQKDQTHFVKMAAYETMRTAEKLIGQTDSMYDASDASIIGSHISDKDGSIKSTQSLTAYDRWSANSRHGSYGNDQEDEIDLFSGVVTGRTMVSGSPLVAYAVNNQEIGSQGESPRLGNQIHCSGVEDNNFDMWSHKRNLTPSGYNKSACSRTNRSRSSRRKARQHSQDVCPQHHRHGFTQDAFTELSDNRQQQQQDTESSTSSSSLCDISGTTTPTNTTEDICEELRSKLDSKAKLKTEGTQTDLPRSRSRRCLKLGLSFFSVAVAGFASFMWLHLQDDMIRPPYLVPT